MLHFLVYRGTALKKNIIRQYGGCLFGTPGYRVVHQIIHIYKKKLSGLLLSLDLVIEEMSETL